MIKFLKKILCLFVMCKFDLIFSQTYISPSIGWEVSNIYSEFTNSEYQTTSNKFSVNNPLIGVKLDHGILNNIYISYLFNYSRKFIPATSNGIQDIEGIRIDCYRNSLQLCYYTKSVFISSGGYVNFISNINEVYESGTVTLHVIDFKKIKEYGLRFSFGVIIDQLEIEVFNYFGLTNPETPNDIAFLTDSFVSMGLQINYNFKLNLIKPNSNREYRCPKF